PDPARPERRAPGRELADSERDRPRDLRRADPARSPVVARRPVSLRGGRRRRRRPRPELLRDAQDLDRRPSGNGIPVRRPERPAAVPAVDAGPGVPPGRILYLSERLV